jgi:hypothetical protein
MHVKAQGDSHPRRVLVLYWHPCGPLRPAIRHHLRAIEASPLRHRVVYHNAHEGSPAWFAGLPFDVIVLHTTLLCLRWAPELLARLKWDLRWLRHCAALKIAMPQDEYDHAEVLDEWLQEMRVSVVCSNFDERYRPLLYPRLRYQARFLECLTGYIDEATAVRIAPRLRPAGERSLDLVYRAAHLPYWFGSQGQLKHDIADVVLRRAEQLGLRCDISTRPQDTITSDHWFDFLASSRAIIGCESGSSVLDRRGEIQARLRWLLLKEPGLSFTEASRRLPAGWDDYRFFAIGPRHLEAVITRTAQLLVEGEYDGILQANRHYIPLRRDLGNLDEALHMVRDATLLDAMTLRAYEDLYLSGRYTYATLAGRLDAVIASAPRRAGLPWPVASTLVRLAEPLLRCRRRLPGLARRVAFFPLRVVRGILRRILRRAGMIRLVRPVGSPLESVSER